MPKEIQITHGLKEGKLVSIADAERGLKCNCTCTKCGKPLVAKKGEVNAHYFAHSADSDCTGETLKHYMAKQEIAEKKYLHLPHPIKDTYSMTDFKTVELEKRIGDSRYIADVICTHESGKQIIIEIVVTHDLDADKWNYLIKNKIPALKIDVNKWDYETERLSDYMVSGRGSWIHNDKMNVNRNISSWVKPDMPNFDEWKIAGFKSRKDCEYFFLSGRDDAPDWVKQEDIKQDKIWKQKMERRKEKLDKAEEESEKRWKKNNEHLRFPWLEQYIKNLRKEGRKRLKERGEEPFQNHL
tara:strand:+ start:424 stop:1317 length:894 start_codon:yes stop_codon:yes gene_type:complete